MGGLNRIYCGDSRELIKKVKDKCVDLIVTSPPYNKGLTTQELSRILYEDEMDEKEYRLMLDQIFMGCHRILKNPGQMFINLKNRIKDKEMLPPLWLLELDSIKQFKLRSLIIWKVAGSFDSSLERYHNDYEFIFHFTKTDGYTFNEKEQSSVWYIPHVMGNSPERTDHPAQYPVKLVRKIILATTNEGDVVFDPFCGVGSTCVASKQTNRQYLGFEIRQDYVEMANKRLSQSVLYDWR